MLTSDLDASPNSQLITSPSLQYPAIVTELSIDRSQVLPIFAEATALAIRLTKSPVAILMTTGKAGCQIGAVAGLAKFTDLPPHADLLAELGGLGYCYAQVMSNEREFSVADCQQHPELAQLPLVTKYGVQAYLGLPIVTAAKDRLGIIAILGFKARQFSSRDIDLLQVISRLVASEFERKLLSQSQLERSIGSLQNPIVPSFDDPTSAIEYANSSPSSDKNVHNSLSANFTTLNGSLSLGLAVDNRDREQLSSAYPQVSGEIQFKLLTHLAQELRTPLTSILGMASVLQQEIYAPLSGKQKDYLGIIHQSGQQLVTIVDEISKLSEFDVLSDRPAADPQLQPALKPVNLEMLCQLALQSLEPIARQKKQQLSLDLAHSHLAATQLTDKVCTIDKDKAQQILYYLCLSLIHTSRIGCQISIQLASWSDRLQMQMLTNDPHVVLEQLTFSTDLDPLACQDLRISLGLSLSYTLATAHGCTIEIIDSGRGYQLSLPLTAAGTGS